MLDFVRITPMAPLHTWSTARDRSRLAHASDDATAAVEYFAEELTDAWEGLSDSRPLANVLLFRGPNGQTGAQHHARLLRRIRPTAVRRMLLRELAQKEWAQYAAASMTLELAVRARAFGSPTWIVQHRSATVADFVIRPGERHIAIECWGMQPDRCSVAFEGFYEALHDYMLVERVKGATGVLSIDFEAGFTPASADELAELALSSISAGTASTHVLDPQVTLQFEPGDEPLQLHVPRGPLLRSPERRLLLGIGPKAKQVEAHFANGADYPCDAGGVVLRSVATLIDPANHVNTGHLLLERLTTKHRKLGFVVAYEDILRGGPDDWCESDDLVLGRVRRPDGLCRAFAIARRTGEFGVTDDEFDALVEMVSDFSRDAT